MGIVHHASYVSYMEVARIEWLRRRGVAYADWAAHGVHLPVVELSVQYRAPARFDDEIDVHVSLVEVGAASVRFAYQLLRASRRHALHRGVDAPRLHRLAARASPHLAGDRRVPPPAGAGRMSARGACVAALLAIPALACRAPASSARLEGRWIGDPRRGCERGGAVRSQRVRHEHRARVPAKRDHRHDREGDAVRSLPARAGGAERRR